MTTPADWEAERQVITLLADAGYPYPDVHASGGGTTVTVNVDERVGETPYAVAWKALDLWARDHGSYSTRLPPERPEMTHGGYVRRLSRYVGPEGGFAGDAMLLI